MTKVSEVELVIGTTYEHLNSGQFRTIIGLNEITRTCHVLVSWGPNPNQQYETTYEFKEVRRLVSTCAWTEVSQ